VSFGLEIGELRAAYARDALAPRRVIEAAHQRIAASPEPVWISRVSLDGMLDALGRAERRRSAGEALPLYGIPFAVKDNIDVAGMPTTAACPAFSYVPNASATVVERLVAAGAVLVGKTNLDQFATGLVGVRSPYGACPNAFDPRYIAGGSSSGSAVAVALGLVSFALGTDTAGSGRVPAALNNVVGLKPTRGLLSNAGVVPACRSLDCVSIFAGTAGDACAVLDVTAGFDSRDAYSRAGALRWPAYVHGACRFGVPRDDELELFGDSEARELFLRAVRHFEALGAERVSVEFAPFRAAAELLYGGPWLAERLSGLEDFFRTHAADVDPTVLEIVSDAARFRATEVFDSERRLRELARETARVWSSIDVLLLPTAACVFTIEQVRADPVRLNTQLGYYTNFANLLDLSAVAVPAGFRASGLPFGVSLLAPAFHELGLAKLADDLHRQSHGSIGVSGTAPSETSRIVARPRLATGDVLLAVVGAHLSGQPLNHELVSRGARLIRSCRTARDYRLYALAGTKPPKPGLVREPGFGGPGIEVEVWSIELEAFGSFVAGVPAPLAIGSLELEDGVEVRGFVCEPRAVQGAREITELGGWRRYVESVRPAPLGG
jgi:allophanate hydrolase